MPSEEAISELIEDKFVTVKEELEEIIDEVKNDVDEKTVQISNNKRVQDQSFEQIHNAMEKLRKDLKQLGMVCFFCTYIADSPLHILYLQTYPDMDLYFHWRKGIRKSSKFDIFHFTPFLQYIAWGGRKSKSFAIIFNFIQFQYQNKTSLTKEKCLRTF